MKNLQKQVDEWIARFEEGYWPPLTNLARLMEEVGELSRIMNHSFGSKYKKPEEQEQKLSEELADVLFVIICIANEQNIDLEVAFEDVMEKYHTRDSNRWAPKRISEEEVEA
ncbi:MAG: nucleotide pyrophosphohydrolase [Gemmatimonadetes bacterium]|nr:nucleotide pyrophosphohydrolase [Gemmatimonadota bacterium]|tara:strand:+ start:1601 stop:1936 length:336 start_codon:yes stop_codon:yes gene_type:complete